MSPHFPTEPSAIRDRPSLYSWGWSWPPNLSVTLSKCWAYRCVPGHQAPLSTLILASVLCFVQRASCVMDCTATEGLCVVLVLLGCLSASPSVQCCEALRQLLLALMTEILCLSAKHKRPFEKQDELYTTTFDFPSSEVVTLSQLGHHTWFQMFVLLPWLQPF